MRFELMSHFRDYNLSRVAVSSTHPKIQVGCPSWTRTKIVGFKDQRPTLDEQAIILADREGFEPSCPVRDHHFSKVRRLASLATIHYLADGVGFEPT